MNVFITGATGFVGRALTLRLRRDGHQVTAYTRSPERARAVLGDEASYLGSDSGMESLVAAVAQADAIVNLAGEPILGGRWTDTKRKALRESRLQTTRELVEAIAMTPSRPRVLVSTSAVGAYGDGGSEILTEDSPTAHDFLGRLCVDWETEAFRARTSGVRVVALRVGVVLGRQGGALDQMLPPFRLGLGGPIGSGRQFVPWIHLDDLVELYATAITDERYHGVVNATGPEPVPFKDLAHAIGEVLGRPAVLPVPAFAIKALFGDASVVLLQGQRAVPERARSLGFQHRYSTVRSALLDLLDNGSVHIGPFEGPLPDSEYLQKNPPVYELLARTTFNRPLGEVFPFFSRPENLGLITPPGMKFRIRKMPESMKSGALIDYSLRLGPIPVNWQTRIDQYEPGVRFVDTQAKGPYATWWHEHAFEEVGDQTIMTDRVLYTPPVGPVGRLANAVYIADELRRVFGYRESVMRLRFGTEPS